MSMLIAVDFDGTCVDHRFPEVGPDVPGAVDVLHRLNMEGHQLILWTMRSGRFLGAAVKWFEERGIPLHGVNNNVQQNDWTDSRKVYAQVYIDDAALGAPLIQVTGFMRECVNWNSVRQYFFPHEHVLGQAE